MAGGQAVALGAPSGLTAFGVAFVLSLFPSMRKLRGWLLIVIACGAVFLYQVQGAKALKHYAAVEEEYAQALSMYERNYPAINPDSPSFDPAVTEAVAAKMEYYLADGLSKRQALDRAIRDSFFARAHQAEAPKSKPEPERRPVNDDAHEAGVARMRAEAARNSEIARRTDGGQVRDGVYREPGAKCEYKSVMTKEDFAACGIDYQAR